MGLHSNIVLLERLPNCNFMLFFTELRQCRGMSKDLLLIISYHLKICTRTMNPSIIIGFADVLKNMPQQECIVVVDLRSLVQGFINNATALLCEAVCAGFS